MNPIDESDDYVVITQETHYYPRIVKLQQYASFDEAKLYVANKNLSPHFKCIQMLEELHMKCSPDWDLYRSVSWYKTNPRTKEKIYANCDETFQDFYDYMITHNYTKKEINQARNQSPMLEGHYL